MATAVGRAFAHPVFLVAFVAILGLSAAVYLSGIVAVPPPIKSDGWGYYLYLPATFIYGDLHLSFLKDPHLAALFADYSDDGRWHGVYAVNGGFLDKYPVGVAVLQLPFFLVALLVARVTLPAPVTGFETPFQVASTVSAAFWCALGLLLCYRAMRLRSRRPAALATVIFAFATTNLVHYATVDGSFAHVYGFCLVAGLGLLTTHRVEKGGMPSLAEFALFGLLMGVAVMVRPTNAVVGLLYLVFIRESDRRTIALGTLVAFAAAVAGMLPQLAAWYATTGDLIYYAYTREGFRFLAPQIGAYLFSVRKGAFFWHPAYLLMVVATIAQIPRRRLESIVILAIVALNVYLGASWWDYSFGYSFGSRQIIEMLPLLMLPTAAAIDRLASVRLRVAATALAALLAVLNVAHAYGYATRRLPHDRTTPEIYLAFWRHTLGLR